MKYLFLLLILCCAIPIFAQNDSLQVDTTDLDLLKNLKATQKASALQEIINQKITVASRKALSQRESPSIVSVITSEEIQKSGARDLIDILRLIPGYDVGLGIDQTISLSVRGNFIDGGKVAIFLDGFELNETAYQGFPLGNHIAVNTIDHIEIIRGAGSAVYGGTAALGVINIITKKDTGFRAYLTTATTAKAPSRTNLELNWAGKKNDFSYWVSAYLANAIRSDQIQISDWLVTTTDSAGQEIYQIYKDTFDLSKNNNSSIQTYQLNVGLNYKNTSLRLFGDSYQMQTPNYKMSFQSLAAELKHKIVWNENLSLTAKLVYYNQKPWEYLENKPNNPVPYLYSVTTQRSLANVLLSWNPHKKVNVLFGSEYWLDQANDLRNENRYLGKNTVHYHNFSVYGQGIWRARWFNLTAGLRLDRNNAFGSALVPRIGFTKKIEDFHFKLLYSQAFRSPSIENINLSLNGKIRTERTQVAELELGYQFTPDMIFLGNIFYVNTHDPIIYYYDATSGNTEGSYINFGQVGSAGVELEYKIRQKWGFFNLNYSYYQRLQSSDASRYEVPQQSGLFIQFPAHKLAFNANVNLSKSLNLNVSGNYFGQRYGYTHIDQVSQEWQIGRFDAYFLAHTFLNYRYKQVGISLGINDLFNAKPLFFQAYKGDYSPFPTMSREFLLKLSYEFSK